MRRDTQVHNENSRRWSTQVPPPEVEAVQARNPLIVICLAPHPISPKRGRSRWFLGPLLATSLVAVAAYAQTSREDQPRGRPGTGNNYDPPSLPDATAPELPSQGMAAAPVAGEPSQAGKPQPRARTRRTGRFDLLIDPREIAPRLDAFDKVGMGLKASVSPFAAIGWIGSATYSEAFNRSPNYGQNPKDFAQRLGAAAARASSEGIFSTSVMAPILHEDPRFFVEGSGRPGLQRAWYAVTRVLVTRSDSGGGTVNFALLTGNAIGAALTQTYYPAGNRNLRETATTFGTSLGGSAVKYLLEEFFYKEASITQLKAKL